MKPANYDPSMGEQHPGNDPTLWEYNIKCKIKVVKSSTIQGMQGGASEFDAVVLLPEMNDEAVRFYGAWLPDGRLDENNQIAGHEVTMYLKDPPYGSCRARVQRAGPFCNEPHIFVMSVGIEEELAKRAETQSNINLLINPATMDDAADTAIDPNSKNYTIIDPGIK